MVEGYSELVPENEEAEEEEDDWEGLNDEEVEKILEDQPKLSKKTEIFEGKVVQVEKLV